jgi:D-alanine--poly(phosphoribitol) ligase subunit 2
MGSLVHHYWRIAAPAAIVKPATRFSPEKSVNLSDLAEFAKGWPRPARQKGAKVKDELVSLVIKALRETNGQEIKLPGVLGTETSLFGQEGILDSLGLVTLVVSVEQAIEDEFGVSVSLADEKAMSQRNSPYRTIGSLAEYADRVLKAEASDA